MGRANAAFMPVLGLGRRMVGRPRSRRSTASPRNVSLFADGASTTDGRAPIPGRRSARSLMTRNRNRSSSPDRESGLIHRFSASHGLDLDRLRSWCRADWPAQGLAPILSIWSQATDRHHERRIRQPPTPRRGILRRRNGASSGSLVFDDRLYYAVADSLHDLVDRVDATMALSAMTPPSNSRACPSPAQPKSPTITFDEQGRMLLAERPASRPAPSVSSRSPRRRSAARCAMRACATDPGRSTCLARNCLTNYRHRVSARDDRNVDGGVADGYAYAPSASPVRLLRRFLWTTGENLRAVADPALVARLARSRAFHVDGLQGKDTWLDSPRNDPPLTSYFIADDDARGRRLARSYGRYRPSSRLRAAEPTTTAAASGPSRLIRRRPAAEIARRLRLGRRQRQRHRRRAGGVRRTPSSRRCGRRMPAELSSTGPRDRRQMLPAGVIARQSAHANSGCPQDKRRLGRAAPVARAHTSTPDRTALPPVARATVVNGQCAPPPPCAPSANNPNCPSGCAPGYAAIGGACCLASQVTSTGVCCPAGGPPSGPNKSACARLVHIPIGPLCCAAGLIPTASGVCCAVANATSTGVCCSRPVDPNNRSISSGAAPARSSSSIAAGEPGPFPVARPATP